MTLATVIPEVMPDSSVEQVVLDGISWESYENLLHDLEESHVKLTYDNGVLEIMAPLERHEELKKFVGRMIEIMTMELGIDIRMLGSATFRRKDLAKGLEPDECYYVAHEPDIKGKDKLDLGIDPPPDLAIEVEETRRAVAREPIYAALRVPEIWRLDAKRLKVCRLQVDGAYCESPTSGVFPFLPMREFERFVLRMKAERQLTVLREFRDWVLTLPRTL